MKDKSLQFQNPTFKQRLYLFGIKKNIYSFVEGLSIMLQAGVNFQEAVKSMEEETTSKRMRKLIEQVYQEVDQGESIAVALNHTGMLTQHMFALIQSGESAGRLSENMDLLVLQNEKEELFRSKVRSSLLYGVVVLTAALVVGIGVAWYILPQIAGFFVNFDAELPLLTRGLISIGLFTKAYGLIIFPIAGAGLFMMLYFLFSFPKTRFLGHSILFHTPVIKDLIRNAEIARFGFLFGTMLQAGMSIIDALDSLQSATSFKNYARCYQHMATEIENGSSLLDSMRSHPQTKNLFRGPALSLLNAAEKSGNLSGTLLKIGSIYEKKTEALSRNIPVLIEPILLLVVGVMVALLALGILMPIYNIGLVL